MLAERDNIKDEVDLLVNMISNVKDDKYWITDKLTLVTEKKEEF